MRGMECRAMISVKIRKKASFDFSGGGNGTAAVTDLVHKPASSSSRIPMRPGTDGMTCDGMGWDGMGCARIEFVNAKKRLPCSHSIPFHQCNAMQCNATSS